MVAGTRWQPVGEQFAYACMVCKHGEDTAMTIKCETCRMEKKSGFEFDPNRYISFIRSMEDKVRELKYKTMPSKELMEDRDFWENIAEAALRRLY